MAKARIMVVEDEGVVAHQIAEALKGMDYEVPLMAMTGEEAVSRLSWTRSPTSCSWTSISRAA